MQKVKVILASNWVKYTHVYVGNMLINVVGLYRFKTNACRRAHEKGHDPAQASECGICGKQFKTRTLARIHVKSQHINENERSQCSLCGAIFKRKESVKRHMEIVHNNVR